MKLTIVGAGPAGLSTAILVRQAMAAEIVILEAGAEDEASGRGIALLPFGLRELQQLGLPGYDAFVSDCVAISQKTHSFAGTYGDDALERQSRIQSTRYFGVSRARLLEFLREGVAHAGIDVKYGVAVTPDRVRAEAQSTDLLIGADGAGSVVRQAFNGGFRPRGDPATSRYAWLELDGRPDHFIFGYVQVPGKGLVRITAYPHGKNVGSAIITHSQGMTEFFSQPEMVDEQGEMTQAAVALLNRYFGKGLGGIPIVGRSRWRHFRPTTCRHAATANVALVGDAFVTVFYETGWGTSSALQGARILRQSLVVKGSVDEALGLYARKAPEICRDLVATSARTMQEIDQQETRMERLGAKAFLATSPA